MIFVALLVVLVYVLVRRRRARKAMLSGLTGDRPVFSVAPPTRRLSPTKGERL